MFIGVLKVKKLFIGCGLFCRFASPVSYASDMYSLQSQNYPVLPTCIPDEWQEIKMTCIILTVVNSLSLNHLLSALAPVLLKDAIVRLSN